MDPLMSFLGLFSATGVAWAFLGVFLKGYLDQKAKNLATREDFAQLLAQQRETTREVEGVKATVQGELWVAQERWKLKRETYSALLESLVQMSHVLSDVQAHLDALPEALEPAQANAYKQQTAGYATQLRDIRDRLEVHVTVAALWLDKEAVNALLQLLSDLSAEREEGHVVMALQGAVRKALGLLIGAARKDFRFPASTAAADLTQTGNALSQVR